MTPRTVAHQAPLSMGFPRHEYWSGLPFPPPGDLPNPGIKPRSPALQASSLPPELPGKPFASGVKLKFLRWGGYPKCSVKTWYDPQGPYKREGGRAETEET